MTTMKDIALKAAEIGRLQSRRIAQLEAERERYQRLLYWALMQKDGQHVPWNGEFRFNHEQGLAWFLNQAELKALGGEQETTSVASSEGAE